MNHPALSVKNLTVSTNHSGRDIKLIDDISFSVAARSTLGIVGESGSGKSLTAQAIMGLLAPTLHAKGSIELGGVEVTTLDSSARRRLRGRHLAMVFQDPMTALNPVYTVGTQIAEALKAHRIVSGKFIRSECIRLLRRVGIPDPERRVDSYPHQMSGGMRQRVVIAIALACRPSLLIADEPTTALDVTVQGQILELFRELQEELQMAMILVSHDLGVIAETADEVVVMYAGEIVERAPVEKLFANPQHPYTIGLLSALPRIGARQPYLSTIKGRVPSPEVERVGCRFANRCPFALSQCEVDRPSFVSVSEEQYSACLRAPLTVSALENNR